ncbi:MAG: PPC domain-containing protein [Anaerolineae bacterium]|nr:PPC domain-containing protein [Anaerolineae bacterium]
MNRLFLARNRIGRRLILVVLTVILPAVVIGSGLVLAQTGTPRHLRIGDIVNGRLDARDFAQVYTFEASAGTTVNVVAVSKTNGLALALLLTNAAGETLARTAELTRAEVAIREFQIAADGTYYITVVRGNGAQAGAAGDFSIALTGSTAAAPATVTLANGMQVALTWNTSDDMNLEVRDPIGNAINFRNPNVQNGGQLSGNVNNSCQNTTADNPTETISWPQGNVSGGSYEIIVYFVQACPAVASTASATESATSSLDTAPSDGTVSFAVTVTVDGKAQEPIRGTLNTNQQYVASYYLSGPDKVELQQGGPNLAINLAPFANKITSPTALNNRASVNGTISRTGPADAWSFQVAANARPITIDLIATSGSLDPLLVLLGPDGNIVASNDDANPDTRNAEINSVTLQAGRYIILATRFGLQIGGTEGNYTLSINTTGANPTARANPTAVPTTGAATQEATSTAGGGLPAGSIEVRLTWNTRADLRLLVRDPNGRSVFSDARNPDNSGILDRLGNFLCQNTVTNPLTYAYWPTSVNPPVGTYEVSVWQESRCTDTQVQPQYTLTVSVRGKEIINQTDRADPQKLHYLTTFTINANGEANAGPGGLVTNTFTGDITAQLPNAEGLTYGGAPATGTISQDNPFVVYTFQGQTGDRVRISMRATSGNLDTLVFLLSADGKTVLAQNDDLEPGKDSNSRIDNFNVTADGTFVVIATRYGVELGGTAGNYELTIARLNR